MLHFLENTLKCLKTGQKRYPYSDPVRNNEPWNNVFHFNITEKYRQIFFASKKFN